MVGGEDVHSGSCKLVQQPDGTPPANGGEELVSFPTVNVEGSEILETGEPLRKVTREGTKVVKIDPSGFEIVLVTFKVDIDGISLVDVVAGSVGVMVKENASVDGLTVVKTAPSDPVVTDVSSTVESEVTTDSPVCRETGVAVPTTTELNIVPSDLVPVIVSEKSVTGDVAGLLLCVAEIGSTPVLAVFGKEEDDFGDAESSPEDVTETVEVKATPEPSTPVVVNEDKVGLSSEDTEEDISDVGVTAVMLVKETPDPSTPLVVIEKGVGPLLAEDTTEDSFRPSEDRDGGSCCNELVWMEVTVGVERPSADVEKDEFAAVVDVWGGVALCGELETTAKDVEDRTVSEGAPFESIIVVVNRTTTGVDWMFGVEDCVKTLDNPGMICEVVDGLGGPE